MKRAIANVEWSDCAPVQADQATEIERLRAELFEADNAKHHLHQIYTTECNLRLTAEAELTEASRQLEIARKVIEDAPHEPKP